MNIKDKINLAHLESQNAIALECIKNIDEAMDDLGACNVDETFASIAEWLEWFKKYGCEK